MKIGIILLLMVLNMSLFAMEEEPIDFKEALENLENALGSGDIRQINEARVVFLKAKKIHDRKKEQLFLGGAAIYGSKKLLEESLKRGAAINEFDKHGNTPLLWACCKDERGDVALMGAEKPKAQKIALLLEMGANPNLADKAKGRTPMRWLLRMHEGSPVKSDVKKLTTAELLPCYFLLMCAGADPEIKDIYDTNLLYWIDKQKFNDEERALINRILLINKNTASIEKAKILIDIYLFQKRAFNVVEPKESNNEKFVLWKMYKRGKIRRSFVCNEKRLPFDRFAYAMTFHEIFTKYIA